MVGDEIFSTLGVVIEIAGAWAWLSFFSFSSRLPLSNPVERCKERFSEKRKV
jgi:hypothetical protein